MRRLLPALLTLALLVPGAAVAATIEADTSDYPVVRATFVAEEATPIAPTVTENGQEVSDVIATNLGRAKSIMLTIDRSRSMDGQPLVDAVAAARAFVAAKPDEDRIAVTTYATEPLLLTGFQTSTTDADSALRTISVDDVQGTKLYDAIVLSANALASETYLGRVIILVTDGNETESEASLEGAIAAAQNAGAAVYVVAIESRLFNPEPLQRIAQETGGNYYGAASTAALDDVYRSIAEELSRTWRLEYITSVLPGEKLGVVAEAGGERAEAALVAPGTPVVRRTPAVDGHLPEQFFGSVWGQAAFAAVVGLVILVASAFLFASPKGAWLRGRLGPHVDTTRRLAAKQSGGDRLRMAAGLFRATEATLGKFKPWQRVHQLLERADLPLRTAEFVYIMLGGALLLGLVAAGFTRSVPLILLGLAAGGLLPYLFLSFKARKRVKAFENQLPDLLVTMAAGLKAGHSFRQALQSVVDEDQPPASKELKRVLTETRLGRPMDEALVEMAHRLGSKNFEFVITAVTIQRQVGGSLAGLFDMVADTVRNRQQFAKKIKGLTAMGRASVYVLVALPFFVASMLTLINAEYMSPLWHTSTGHKLIAVMLVMMAFGSLVLRKIVNFRY
ncbi:MAG TPA: type II secretion system F family protein [Gaiellaceae bacterium]|nr:type II secretion system F family protein [Gaiellaceae bacterium]